MLLLEQISTFNQQFIKDNTHLMFTKIKFWYQESLRLNAEGIY